MRTRPVTMVAAVAIVLAAAALWFTNRAVTPKMPTWDDVVQEAKDGGYRLLTTEELRALYEKNQPGLLLVDTRQDWEHRAGHITGR